MKNLLITSFLFPFIAGAIEKKCGQNNPDWHLCKSVEECVLATDGCGDKRVPVNKTSLAQAEKYYACSTHKEDCSSEHIEAPNNRFLKCEAYGMHFPGAKPPKTSCVRLSDIVGMAIINEDRVRLTAAIAEAKDVDMPLSHIYETPLTLAALNSKVALVEWLVQKGAKVNFQTKNGYTALMFAATSPSGDKKAIRETISLLLKLGANKSLRNDRGESALDQAKLAKNSEAAELLK